MSTVDERTHQPRTEIVPDDADLRLARRQRVLAEMDAADIDILVVGREANARYVAGVRRLWTAGSRPFGPGAVLMRDGAVHLLSTWDEGVPDDIPKEHLYGISFNAKTFLQVLSNLDGAATARRVATDSLTPSGARMLGKAFPQAEVIDGEQMLRRARGVKLPLEVEALRRSIGVAGHALDTAVDALRPGITQRQLTGVFMEAMAAEGVTTPSTQDVAWVGSLDDPARRTDRDRAVEPGDLVAFDGGVIDDGYFGELGRTVLVPGGDAERQAAAERLLERRDELRRRLLGACMPGTPASALLDTYTAAGEVLPPMPVARGLGLGFDTPLVTPTLSDTAATVRFEPGMVFGLTSFAWQQGIGAAYAFDPIIITDDGAEALASAPSTNEGTTP